MNYNWNNFFTFEMIFITTILPYKETKKEGDSDENGVPLVHLVVHHCYSQVQEDHAVAEEFL